MLEAMAWGLVGGLALVIGAVFGLAVPTSQRVIGLVMGFGSGVLISAVAFELTAEAYEAGDTTAVGLGLAGGALAFFAGDWLVDRRGGVDRKRSGGGQENGNAAAIVVGAALDGIPESVAIGVSLLAGSGVSTAMVVAVFLSNIPESLSASTGLRASGMSRGRIVGLWAGIAAVSAIAAGAGYAALGDASGTVVGTIQAFAGGAILTMLADTMMPEAFEDAGPNVGLLTVLGFAVAFFLAQAS